MSENLPRDQKKNPGPLIAVGLVWEMGLMIAIPAVLFGFGGAWLDKQWGTSPAFIILGFSLALTTSVLSVWKVIKRFL